MPYGTVNADVIQTSTSGGILGAGNASIMKNRIINGAMVIAQRTTSAVTANDSYAVDRWNIGNSTDGAFSAIQDSDAPVGFNKSVKFTITTADASVTGTQGLFMVQPIEGFNIADLNWGTANAKTVTLSFWVKSSVTGTFSGSLMNGSVNRAYPFTYTISSASTWTQASVTIAGDTTGTWNTDNSGGILLYFSLGTGSTRLGTAGAWSASRLQGATGETALVNTVNATWFITGVQLEVGSSATGFEYENYTSLLSKCQRYYWKNIPSGTSAGIALGMVEFSGTPFTGFVIQFPVQMRSAPSFNYSTLNTFAGAISSARGSDSGNMSGTYQLFHSGGTATGYANILRSATGGTGYLDASAEL
jgi:hypothetical protein